MGNSVKFNSSIAIVFRLLVVLPQLLKQVKKQYRDLEHSHSIAVLYVGDPEFRLRSPWQGLHHFHIVKCPDCHSCHIQRPKGLARQVMRSWFMISAHQQVALIMKILMCARLWKGCKTEFMFSMKPHSCSSPEYWRGWIFLYSCCHLKEISQKYSETVYVSRLVRLLAEEGSIWKNEYSKQDISVFRNSLQCPGRFTVQPWLQKDGPRRFLLSAV